MQTLLGVDEPDFGFILDDMVVETDSVAVERFCDPRVEPEVAFLLYGPLHGPHIGPDDVRAATAAVAVALEVVDSRHRNLYAEKSGQSRPNDLPVGRR